MPAGLGDIMIRSSLAGAALVVLAAASPALAQGAPSDGQFLTEAPNTFRATKARGIAVIGQDHTRLGEVEDLLIDRNGKVHAVVIGVGGLLGIGERNLAVPFDQVLWNTGDVARQSDLGASTAPTKETGPESTPPRVLEQMPGAQISSEVLNTPPDAPGNVNPATGPVTAPEPRGPATAILVPPGGTLRHAEIRATKAEIQGAPEFKLR